MSNEPIPHVGTGSPNPVPPPANPSGNSNAAVVVAILWLIAAVFIGANFISSTTLERYGGDAYTGIQQAAAQTARAVGWLIIGTGVLGLVTALSHRR